MKTFALVSAFLVSSVSSSKICVRKQQESPAFLVLPKQDCEVAHSEWQRCDSQDTQTRTKFVARPALYGGTNCTIDSLMDETRACPVSCDTVIVNWGLCDAVSGTSSRSKTLKYRNTDTIKFCPEEVFETKDCSVDCVLGWSGWSICDPATFTTTNIHSVVMPKRGKGIECTLPLPPKYAACTQPVTSVKVYGETEKCISIFDKTGTAIQNVAQYTLSNGFGLYVFKMNITIGTIETTKASNGICSGLTKVVVSYLDFDVFSRMLEKETIESFGIGKDTQIYIDGIEKNSTLATAKVSSYFLAEMNDSLKWYNKNATINRQMAINAYASLQSSVVLSTLNATYSAILSSTLSAENDFARIQNANHDTSLLAITTKQNVQRLVQAKNALIINKQSSDNDVIKLKLQVQLDIINVSKQSLIDTRTALTAKNSKNNATLIAANQKQIDAITIRYTNQTASNLETTLSNTNALDLFTKSLVDKDALTTICITSDLAALAKADKASKDALHLLVVADAVQVKNAKLNVDTKVADIAAQVILDGHNLDALIRGN